MYPFDPLTSARVAVHGIRRGRPLVFDEGPVGDMYREALMEGLPAWVERQQGSLYLACNPAQPDLYKIGRTRLPVAERMKALNGPGVLVPWTAVMAWRVYDAPGLEAAAHRACAQFRIRNELFQAPWQVLADQIEACLADDRERLQGALEPLGAPVPELLAAAPVPMVH